MNLKRTLALAGALVVLTCPAAFSKKKDQKPVESGPKVWMAEQVTGDDPLGMTEAGSNPKKPKHRIIKGLGKELAKSGEYLAKDLCMFLSVQDFDPYEKTSVPLNRPAVVLTFQFNDGERATLTRYPDRSFRVFGSIFDGTVMIPDAGNTFIVKYPNGVQGKLERVNDSLIKSYRPDGTVTTFQKQMGGQFSIHNSKQGYLGMARPDRTGITYED